MANQNEIFYDDKRFRQKAYKRVRFQEPVSIFFGKRTNHFLKKNSTHI